MPITLEGTRPGELTLKLLTVNNSITRTDEVTLWVVDVNLRVDSNNDGLINEEDDESEDELPGMVIPTHCDALIAELSFPVPPGLTDGEVYLEYTGNGNIITLWDEGSQHNPAENLFSRFQNSSTLTFQVKGESAGSADLMARYILGNCTGADRAKVTVEDMQLLELRLSSKDIANKENVYRIFPAGTGFGMNQLQDPCYHGPDEPGHPNRYPNAYTIYHDEVSRFTSNGYEYEDFSIDISAIFTRANQSLLSIPISIRNSMIWEIVEEPDSGTWGSTVLFDPTYGISYTKEYLSPRLGGNYVVEFRASCMETTRAQFNLLPASPSIDPLLPEEFTICLNFAKICADSISITGANKNELLNAYKRKLTQISEHNFDYVFGLKDTNCDGGCWPLYTTLNGVVVYRPKLNQLLWASFASDFLSVVISDEVRRLDYLLLGVCRNTRIESRYSGCFAL